jgi:hypothetical protein
VNLDGARANWFTRWPEGLDLEAAGVIFEDQAVLAELLVGS